MPELLYDRKGSVLVRVGDVVLLAVVLIVFLISNTVRVDAAFPGIRGELPPAIALLIAMAAGTVITLILAATRLRHRVRRRQRPPAARP